MGNRARRGHGVKSELVSNSPRERNSFTITSSIGILTRKAPRVELVPLISTRSRITTLSTRPGYKPYLHFTITFGTAHDQIVPPQLEMEKAFNR